MVIANPVTDLAPSDLPLVADAFWRKDTAGTDSNHAGLGLSLVQAYAKVMNAEFDMKLTEERQFQARLRFRRCNGSSE